MLPRIAPLKGIKSLTINPTQLTKKNDPRHGLILYYLMETMRHKLVLLIPEEEDAILLEKINQPNLEKLKLLKELAPDLEKIVLTHILWQHPCASDSTENHYDVLSNEIMGEGAYGKALVLSGILKFHEDYGYLFEEKNRIGKSEVMKDTSATFFKRINQEVDVLQKLGEFQAKRAIFFHPSTYVCISFFPMKRIKGDTLEKHYIKEREIINKLAENEANKEIIDTLDLTFIDPSIPDDNSPPTDEIIDTLDLTFINPLTATDDRIAAMVSLLLFFEKIRQKNIVHRDIKPSNIMLNFNGRVTTVILDFGLSIDIDADTNNSLQKRCGTFAFVAPEIWDYFEKLTCKLDEFPFGWCIAILFNGTNKFYFDNDDEKYRASDAQNFVESITTSKILQFDHIYDLSNSQKEIICAIVDKLMAINPEKRDYVSALQLAEALMLERNLYHITGKNREAFTKAFNLGISARKELQKNNHHTCSFNNVNTLTTIIKQHVKEIDDSSTYLATFIERTQVECLRGIKNKNALIEKLDNILSDFKNAFITYNKFWIETPKIHTLKKIHPQQLLKQSLTLDNIVKLTKKMQKYCQKYKALTPHSSIFKTNENTNNIQPKVSGPKRKPF